MTIRLLQSQKPTIWIGLLAVTYLLILTFYGLVDVYHQYFFAHGSIVALYNVLRLLFIPCLLGLFYFVGDSFLCYFFKSTYLGLSFFEALIIATLTGLGVWQMLLFPIGLFGLYSYSFLTGLTLFVFAVSVFRKNYGFQLIKVNNESVYVPGLILFLCVFSLFLATKGLYPGGGHDYYNHYFQFYKKVIATGTLLPNEVWYHFYYSKGAGLFFLSMILTDPLSAQILTTTMMLLGASFVYQILNKTSWHMIPWLGAALYIFFLVYTPGPLENWHNGGWGDLEKPHEPASILMLAMLWLTIKLFQEKELKIWGVALIFTLSATVLMSAKTVGIVGAYLMLLIFYSVVMKKNDITKWLIGALCATLFWFVTILMVNYILTGIPEDQWLLSLWPMINFDKVNQWGVLLELLLVHWMKSDLAFHRLDFNYDYLITVLTYIRFDIWGSLFVASLFVYGCYTVRGIIKTRINPTFFICASFLALIFVLSLIGGREQTYSFYRFTSFTYGPMLCLSLLMVTPIVPRRFYSVLLVVFAFSSTWYLAYRDAPGGNMKEIARNGLDFFFGKKSIADAYKQQQKWPGRMPWGGIHPAMEEVCKRVPRGTRIWSMHIHSYCMLPDCQLETFISYRLSPNANAIFYSAPIIAKSILQKENLNYFFIANSLQLTDPLPLTSLFSPEHISKYFGVIWTDGDSVLLTWKENSATLIDAKWLTNYRNQVKESAFLKSYPFIPIKKFLGNQQVSMKPIWNTDKNSL